jgi:hypothetical protein
LIKCLSCEANVATVEVSTRPTNASPKSDQGHAMVKNWPESCLDGHKKCPKPTGDFIPTPLIEIVHIQYHKHPRLCLRKTYRRDFAPYAALGYCWGGNQPVITASKNIYQHIIRFNYIALPAIIQDAMTITSRLGLRYI